jgi:adenosylhomocysteine nucleosidase
MSGHVAFVCAMPMEVAPIRHRLSLADASIGSLKAYRGTLEGRPVVAIVTGMGPELATKGMRELLDEVEVERVVVVGITGATHDETPIGTLVYPEKVVNGASRAEFRPDHLGTVTPSGVMWTTDDLITADDALKELRAIGVIALDMETAAVAEVCVERGIPWSVVRVISDRATDGSVDDEVFHLSNQDGTPNAKAIASYFMRHPGRIALMTRMGREVKAATRQAADAAVDAVERSLRG